MTEMVERVARAIAEAEGDDYCESRSLFEKAARAAIKAMREPTAEMMAAGLAAPVGDLTVRDILEDANRGGETLIAAYTAIIEAALGEDNG